MNSAEIHESESEILQDSNWTLIFKPEEGIYPAYYMLCPQNIPYCIGFGTGATVREAMINAKNRLIETVQILNKRIEMLECAVNEKKENEVKP